MSHRSQGVETTEGGRGGGSFGGDDIVGEGGWRRGRHGRGGSIADSRVLLVADQDDIITSAEVAVGGTVLAVGEGISPAAEEGGSAIDAPRRGGYT